MSQQYPSRAIVQKGQKPDRRAAFCADLALVKDVQYVNQALRDCAKNQPCMLLVPGVCNRDNSTTVWCHSNLSRHGKGERRKAHDCYAALGCFACHTWLDTGKASAAEKEAVFIAGFERTQLHCWRAGIFRVCKP